MPDKLANHAAFVTGASRWIGAEMISYLAGPEAKYITGACLNIDGGFSI